MLIDFHTHIFPEKIAARALKKLEEGIILTQGKLLLSPCTDATISGLISSMDKCGIDISVIMPIATSPTQHTTINTYASQITDNKRIISFGSIHPSQEGWEKSLEDISESGLRGIKLHSEFQNFYADESIIFDIVKKCEEFNLYVLFHSGVDFGYHPPVRCTPQRLRHIIDKTGCQNIIAAHLGGFLMWDEVEKYLVGTPVIMDTSMTNGFIDKEQYKAIIRKHGADKFLFGSDSPWGDQKKAYDFLVSLNLTGEEMELITYKNAEKILFNA